MDEAISERADQAEVHAPRRRVGADGRSLGQGPSPGCESGKRRATAAGAGYDAKLPLVIDPVISYSTYLGGSGEENVADLTVDRSGSAYVPGDTNSEDFPVTPRAFQQAYGGGDADGYVTKLNPAGTRAVYSTYLGGSGFDVAGSVRVDRDGVAHVPGITGSADFPVTSGAFQDGYGGGPTDAFLVLLNRNGSRLRFGSYLGGSGEDGSSGAGSWLDGKGNYFIPGFTDSADFPVTPGAFQTENADAFDVFLVKVDLGKGHKGSGQGPGSVTAQERGARARGRA
jgi:hypothetical protein